MIVVIDPVDFRHSSNFFILEQLSAFSQVLEFIPTLSPGPIKSPSPRS